MSTERRYDPKTVEPKWQAIWEDERTWEVGNDDVAGADNFYVAEMLPYPSGEPHMGHLKNYAVGDAVAHFQRRMGRRVLHPIGYDAFGLPAENHAIRSGRHPRDSTAEAIAAFQREFRSWGVSFDWSREIATHEPCYYRWTQWIFLKLYERGLAYRSRAAVNWCPKDQTVLANEQVIDGRCERCGTLVEARQLEQWFFRITDYADRLLDDLETVEWPSHVVRMQQNWIGRSEGAEVTFAAPEMGVDYPVFTTRPDTLFGATFFVMAPEHPDVLRLAEGTEHEAAVRDYVNHALTESHEDRGDVDREKTGVPLGRTVINPVNGERIPMWVADYVLMEYGTGAIMAVPAHDARDFEFATKYELPIRRVIEGPDDELPYTGDGPLVNSDRRFDGNPNREALELIVDWLDEQGRGHRSINYRLRDWLLSRQRYWGCPIPIIHCERCGLVPVPVDQLPVELPDVRDYAPKGRSPLAAAEDWVNVDCPSCGGAGAPRDGHDGHLRRLLLVLPALLRRAQRRGAVGPGRARPLDAGRPVHRRRRARDPAPDVRPLLRQGAGGHGPARLPGAVPAPVHPGHDHPRRGEDVQVQGQRDQPGRLRRALRRGHRALLHPLHRAARSGRRLVRRGRRGRAPLPRRGCGGSASTSPSRSDAPGPALGPLETPEGDDLELMRKAHWAIDKVTNDMAGRFAFNTAIAAVMELVNECYRRRDAVQTATLHFATATAASLIFPFAPHCGAEVYEALTGERVWEQPWPDADPAMLERDTVELVVQVNGKLRDRVQAPAAASRDELEALARTPRLRGARDGKEVVKVVVVPGKLVNFVVR